MGVPERLSGMTRNHVGFAAGSNPAAHDLFILHKNLFYIKNKMLEISNPAAHDLFILDKNLFYIRNKILEISNPSSHTSTYTIFHPLILHKNLFYIKNVQKSILH